MKSHELAKILMENPDVELIVQVDSEGNGYTPLRGIELDVVYLDGEVYSKEGTADDHCMDSAEWRNLKRRKPKFAVLFP